MIKKEVKKLIQGYISSGMEYKEVVDKLKEQNLSYPSINHRYSEWKKELFPEVAGAVEKTVEGQIAQQKEQKRAKRPEWTTKKQKEADASKLAELVNKGICSLVPCKCKPEDLDGWRKDCADINLGGATVGLVMYAIPNINLDHPVIVFVTRLLVWLLAFKKKCLTMFTRKTGNESDHSTGKTPAEDELGLEDGSGDVVSGIKPGWK